MIKRLYYRVLYPDRCFKCTLKERIYACFDPIEWDIVYLGHDWWLRPEHYRK